MSWPHDVGLLEISHLLNLDVRIGLLVIVSSPGFSFPRFPMAEEDICNGRNGGNAPHSSLLEFPVDNLCSNPCKGRTSAPVSFQLCSDRKDLSNHGTASLSPDPFRGTALIVKPFDSVLLISLEPFEEPALAPMNKMKNFLEALSLLIKLYCLISFLIIAWTLYRHSLPPRFFGRSVGDV
jgi:hypothetical protein